MHICHAIGYYLRTSSLNITPGLITCRVCLYVQKLFN
uniref:Uncharacterized protein n=1 Tax=Lepeophtheirus salmonis TaxID=72036 RepID=A0A0K2UXD5_LEPSM